MSISKKPGGGSRQSAKVRDFNFQDRVAAILTLEDSRHLRMQLVGTGASPTTFDADYLAGCE